jgi:peptide/nickel transport system substrate-binding protein
MAPFNLRIKGQEGGQVKSATTATLFTDPWNPVNGSNWVTSAFVQNAVQGDGLMPDPYTGLAWPLRAERADVTVQTGLPVATNYDWVTLDTADTITVPADAWVDWDATNQKFITAGEKFPEGVTAKTKSVIYYPADLFETVKWHDGSNLSVADFVMWMIMNFEQGKPESAIYDEDVAANLEAFLTHFKGVQIVSTDPLTIATYDDNFYADAELDVTSWWPQYGYGEAPWQSIAIRGKQGTGLGHWSG